VKILDWYILKRYLVTFLFTLLILIPIAIAIDIAEKIDNFLANEDLSFFTVIDEYYKNFVIYYSNTFMPLALFIAVILFTSKLASNTEIVAMINARISFTRLLYPYFIGATLITIFAILMNHFVVPNSNKVRKEFEKAYIHKYKRNQYKYVNNFSLQLNDSTYIYVKSFNLHNNLGSHFSIEGYDGVELKSKLYSDQIKWIEKDSTFKLTNCKIRLLHSKRDSIQYFYNIDTTFAFTPKDLMYKSTLAQELPSYELTKFIDLSRERGVKNLNSHLVELYKRTSLPMSSYILTLIAVALAFRKKRGGVGVNLALGIGIMFLYVFFLKVAEVLGSVAGSSPLIYVWVPNLLFGFLALYLYYNARK